VKYRAAEKVVEEVDGVECDYLKKELKPNTGLGEPNWLGERILDGTRVNTGGGIYGKLKNRGKCNGRVKRGKSPSGMKGIHSSSSSNQTTSTKNNGKGT